MKPTLLILAAGMGSRYGGLKQMDPLGPHGETIIDYSVYDAKKAGFGKVIFVIRRGFAEEFKNKISSKYSGIEVDHVFQELDTPIEGVSYSSEREKPWGTGHAVLVAKEAIHEPFAVINADDYYGSSGFKIMADFLTSDASTSHYSMLGFVLDKTLSDNGTVSRGICHTNDSNYLLDVVERTKIGRDGGKINYWENDRAIELDPNSIVSMNFWGFHPNVFDHIKSQFQEFANENKGNPKSEFYIPSFVNRMLLEKSIKMTVLKSEDQWFGVTYKEDREVVVTEFSNLVKKGTYPSPLW